MHVLAASALVVALAAASEQPKPLAAQTPAPSASGAPLALPEIGRVRSATPACAAMRDLIIPSFAAARRADARFVETKKSLPRYAEIADDKETTYSIFHQQVLMQLDRDSTALIAEAEHIRRALNDPRLDPKSADPQVVAERAQLQQLYDVQSTRAHALWEFVQRESRDLQLNDFGNNSGLGRGMPGPPPPVQRGAPAPAQKADLNADDSPIARQTATPINLPPMSGQSMTDKSALNGWTGQINIMVSTAENQAAKTFLPIAQSCR